MVRLLQHPPPIPLAGFFLILLTSPSISHGIRTTPENRHVGLLFSEAPEYRNSPDECPRGDSQFVHVAMTLDSEYLRGTIAAVHSVLRHATCPESVFFHLVAAEFDPGATPRALARLVRTVFPSLHFKVYVFREDAVVNLISPSVRSALENPLNYARSYLGDLLDRSVDRVIYLDSDLILVDDVRKLWETKLSYGKAIGAPEYCHANFTKYFTRAFWSDPALTREVFGSRNPCYFNTGVMVMDLARWREGHFREKVEKWMEMQRTKRIYELGSLPPFLLVVGGDVEPIDHRWNQHGLGGDNVAGSCRPLHPGPVSLMHWSGKGKPWVRLDEKRPCALDYLWEPYDLYSGKERRSKNVLDSTLKLIDSF